ncbi:siderophore-interacting protein [Streptomyces sp. RFCAC02]|uniref:siderophore-interacting protein n=1 Tax=Streptomyces sp. RFCAC02 TaxID=2499143 RepID=UPI0019D0FBA6|nr:siderophore-interacting protein [Streptomyces sp. RFCAC02]
MSVRDLLPVTGTVTAVAPSAAGRIRGVRIVCGPLRWTPGQEVEVLTGGLLGPRRTYSVWDRTDDGIDLRILDHGGEGPGARWARAVRPGDRVLLSRPSGRLVARPAPYHLFAGDETASVAFGPMLRALLAEGATVRTVVEVASPAERLPLPGPVTWRFRDGASAVASPGLLAAVADLPLPDGPGAAYIAGEARTVQAVRRHLTHDRGWPRAAVTAKAFWHTRR